MPASQKTKNRDADPQKVVFYLHVTCLFVFLEKKPGFLSRSSGSNSGTAHLGQLEFWPGTGEEKHGTQKEHLSFDIHS